MSKNESPLVASSTMLIGIDDTDTVDSEYGTGRVSRLLGDHLSETLPGLTYRGSVRQQLVIDPQVPYTTHNSAACLLCEWPADEPRESVVERAGTFLEDVAADGSDPGLCAGRVAEVTDAVGQFGVDAGETVLDESQAYDLAADAGLYLSAYGGTGQGVIGALAAIGRTASGRRGRFVDVGRAREFDGEVTVERIREEGVRVRRPTGAPVEAGTVETGGWVRPLLRDGRPTLPVEKLGTDRYRPANLDG